MIVRSTISVGRRDTGQLSTLKMNADQRRKGLRGNTDLNSIVGSVVLLTRCTNSSFKNTKAGITRRVYNRSSKLLISTTKALMTIVTTTTILRHL